MLQSNKKSSLLEYVPHGLVVTKAWLLSQGLSRHTLDNWVKSEQLTSIFYGVYKRPDTKLTWRGLVYSLQRMGSDLCPGGITALSSQGLGHYVELGQQKTIHLYGKDSMPSWLNSLLPNVIFIRHNEMKLLGKGDPISSIDLNQEFTTTMALELTLAEHEGIEAVRASTAEKAWFEVLLDVPEKISFEHADQLMQGLGILSPRKLNKLLEVCHNVKVRRLFLWFAERHQHSWFKKLETERYTIASGLLGSGKRVLAKGGKLDSKYLITVPEEMLENSSYG